MAPLPPEAPLASGPALGLDSRRLVWRALQAVAAGAYADAALERELARHSLPGPDRALATELLYGAVRQRRLLDAWIDAHGRVPAERQPPTLRWLLHVGLYQLLFSERVPAAAAVHTTVDLAKQGGLARLAPVVNGLLRAVLRRRDAVAARPGLSAPWLGLPLPADPAEALGLRHSLPGWLADALVGWLPADAAEAFASASNLPPSLDLRVNPLRGSREALQADLAAAGIAADPLSDCPLGLVLRDRPGDLRSLPGYGEGRWCVQDRAAQRIVPLLDPQPGERVLDACAAPGGKSTQIAEAMADRGEVWAIDRSAARLQRLEANAARLGLTAIRSEAADATELADPHPEWRGAFDRVLLDAPCSGLGTLARHADARWRVQPAAIEELVVLQTRLLEALLPLLRPGGRLVYATCTVHPRENTERIEALLAAHPGWRCLRQQQWWPGQGEGDGFYVAVLEAPQGAAALSAAAQGGGGGADTGGGGGL